MQQLATRSTTASSPPVPHLVEFTVRLADGGRFSVTATSGSRMSDAIRRYGLPLKSECEGRCMCASCHMRVAASWANRLEPPNADERAVLSALLDAGPRSRLVCQLIMTADLDGLDIELDPASLVPQTNWAAG